MSRDNNPTKDWALDCKVYVGDLGCGAAKQELEEKFGRFGALKNVWVARNPPGFAFVEFEDPDDAEDATRSLNGTRINNRHCRVEMSSGKSRWGSGGPPVRRSGPPRRDDYYSRGPRRRSYGRSPSPRYRSRSPYRSRSRSPRGRDWNRDRDRSRGDRR